MSQLIQMRQRIKAIETIKKVTHAMRLISMSSHSQLRHTLEPLKAYRHEIVSLLSNIRTHATDWTHPLLGAHEKELNTRLLVIVGSQKGLCGSFNTTLLKRADDYLKEHGTNASIIAIGKKAIDYAQTMAPDQTVEIYSDFNIRTLPKIAHELTDYIAKNAQTFGYVDVLSNEFVSFFLQRPHTTAIVPVVEPKTEGKRSTESYLWEMPAETILDALVEQYLNSSVMHLLYQSLLAEHAARFLSMDNSTRNAETLLEETQLKYNKLRQAKITKELTELSASY